MIRQATRYDIPKLKEMVRQYALEDPSITLFKDASLHHPDYVEQLLFSIIMGKGLALVDDEMRGCFIAIRSYNIWCPEVKELHQLMWWVEPEHRGVLSGRLWMAFDKEAARMLNEKEIDLVFTSVNAKGTLTDFTKRGYSAIEAKFFRSK